MSGTSVRSNGQASGPVLTSKFLFFSGPQWVGKLIRIRCMLGKIRTCCFWFRYLEATADRRINVVDVRQWEKDTILVCYDDEYPHRHTTDYPSKSMVSWHEMGRELTTTTTATKAEEVVTSHGPFGPPRSLFTTS